MTKTRITAAALLGLLLAATAALRCSAATSDISKNSLQGLPGVYVGVVNLLFDAEKAGLTRGQLTTDVELRLRQAGIRVLTKDEWAKTPELPCLTVEVAMFNVSSGPQYTIDLRLSQVLELPRDPTVCFTVATWVTDCHGAGGVGVVRQSARDLADRFANDFLSVNPKK